jgi:hypothetical protein
MTAQEKFAIYGNAIIFQALWFASILGAKAYVAWPAVLLLFILIIWGFVFSKQYRPDLRMVIVGVLVAFSVEPIWIGQGLVVYPLQPESYFPPLWIVALWVGFAVSFNHSLKWLQNRYLLGAALGGFGSVCSITAAFRLEAIGLPQGWLAFVIQYGLIWAIIVPILSWYSKKIAGDKPVTSLSASNQVTLP